jgi:hypothetical protein
MGRSSAFEIKREKRVQKTHYRLIPNPKGSSNTSPKKTIWGPKPESKHRDEERETRGRVCEY